MISFKCVNIASKDSKALADFYRAIGAPASVEGEDYDGWNIGDLGNGGTVCVWNEENWGKSTAGYITVVFETDDLSKTYEDIKSNGINIDPPRKADWGGEELVFNDPDGNIVMFLQR